MAATGEIFFENHTHPPVKEKGCGGDDAEARVCFELLITCSGHTVVVGTLDFDLPFGTGLSPAAYATLWSAM